MDLLHTEGTRKKLGNVLQTLLLLALSILGCDLVDLIMCVCLCVYVQAEILHGYRQ